MPFIKYLIIAVWVLTGAAAVLWCLGSYCLGRYGSDDDDETCGLLEED